MYHIRYYDKKIHPDTLTGVLGFIVFVLNWIRWKLEVIVQRLMLSYLVKAGGIPRDREIQLKRMFSFDVKAEKLERERTSPRMPQALEGFPSVMRSGYSSRFGGVLESVDDESDKEKEVSRPESIQGLIARYSAPKRMRGYAARHEFNVVDVTNDEGEEGGFRGTISLGRGGSK